MQRQTFHDIRPKQTGQKRVQSGSPLSIKDKVPTEGASSEKQDFFSYVKGENTTRKRKRTNPSFTHGSPLGDRAELKPVFNAPEFRRVSGTREHGRSGSGIWWVASIFLAVLVLLIMNMFSKAVITITPRMETVFLDGSFTLIEQASVEEDDLSKELPYQTVVVSVDDEKEVPAVGEEEVAHRASGRIVVYNTYSTSDQRLVKRTRFEDAAGHIYRINESVVVPGMKELNGEIIPGSIEVTVYAEEPGEMYNIGLADFTIPGFKDSGMIEQYEKFYARSKTEMVGGFVGMQKVARDEDIERAHVELEDSLRARLFSECIASLPEGYMLIEGSEIVTYNHAAPVESGNSAVLIASSGTMQAMIARERDVAELVAYNSAGSYEGEAVSLLFRDKLSVVLEKTPSDDGEGKGSTVHIVGSAKILWECDTQLIREELLGVSRKEFDAIMSQYPNIEHVSVSIRPFWNTVFPEDPDDISFALMVGAI
jgi:hypothetical protein